MCKRPYIKRPMGQYKKTLLSREYRDSMTPYPCGQCLQCRINKAREWTLRIMLEQAASACSCFLTLTYDNEMLPPHCSLWKEDLKRFFRKLRKYASPTKFRFYAIGEYGIEGNKRIFNPHYHVALFGLSNQQYEYYCKAWKFEGVSIGKIHSGDINADSARYITGYITEKLDKPGGLTSEDPEVRAKRAEWLSANFPWFVPGIHEWEYQTSSKQDGGIGLPGIKKIAKTIMENEHWDISNVQRELKIGGKDYPLGRYLTRKLAEEIGTDADEFEKEYLIYQQQIFADHIKDDDGSMGYYNSIVEENEHKRYCQEYRRTIKKRRKML